MTILRNFRGFCIAIVLGAACSACQPPNQDRSKQQSEKEAKVRRAVDQVAESADQVMARGMRTAEEMKREVVKLAERAKTDALSYKSAGEQIESSLNTSVDGIRSGIEIGKESLRAQVHAAAKAVEESTRPLKSASNDGFDDPPPAKQGSKRF